MNIFLFILAYLLLFPLTFINFFNVEKGERKGYFLDTAKSMDIFGNRDYRATWNKWFRNSEGRKFGVQGETISLVLGYNQYEGTLTRTGWVLVYILDTIQKNHCFIAADLPYDKDCDRLITIKFKKLYFNIKLLFISLLPKIKLKLNSKK